MSELTTPQPEAATPRRWGAGVLLWALIPLLLLGILLAVLVITGAGLGARTAPPIEELTVDRITLPAPGQIVVEVTNGGADPVTVAQVQVDDAYWSFTITPAATITLPYPWVQDEAHAVKIVSSNGVTFEGGFRLRLGHRRPMRGRSGSMRCWGSTSASFRSVWACSGTRSYAASAAAGCRRC